MFAETGKDVLMLGFVETIWEGFIVVSATHFYSRGFQPYVKSVGALCSRFFVAAVAML